MNSDLGQISVPLGLEQISDVLRQGLTTPSSRFDLLRGALTTGFLERLALRDWLEF